MKIFGIFKSSDYKKSPNRETYEEIAGIFGLDAQVVYELAHGNKPRTREEMEAQENLLDKGIIGKRTRS